MWKKMQKETEFVIINKNNTLVEIKICWGNCPTVFPDVHYVSISDASSPPFTLLVIGSFLKIWHPCICNTAQDMGDAVPLMVRQVMCHSS